MKRDKLITAVREYVSNWYVIHNEYVLWETYWTREVGNKILQIIMPKGHTVWGVFMPYKTDNIYKVFKWIVRKTNALISDRPSVYSLSYEDSLRWLYHHYPYGDTDNRNAILVNHNKEVIAVSYHWLKESSVIISNWCEATGWFIYNNRLEVNVGKTKLSTWNEIPANLEKILIHLYNNK